MIQRFSNLCYVKIYSLIYCLPLLPRFWTFMYILLTLRIYTLSLTLSELERGWMSTSNSKSVARCKKNACSSKYIFLIPQQNKIQKLVRLMKGHEVDAIGMFHID